MLEVYDFLLIDGLKSEEEFIETAKDIARLFPQMFPSYPILSIDDSTISSQFHNVDGAHYSNVSQTLPSH